MSIEQAIALLDKEIYNAALEDAYNPLTDNREKLPKPEKISQKALAKIFENGNIRDKWYKKQDEICPK